MTADDALSIVLEARNERSDVARIADVATVRRRTSL